ncbi:MAG: exosortase family protein XrtM [Nevskia sp.]|nr:exosortase family protein XrtM [Nevskia sp.]
MNETYHRRSTQYPVGWAFILVFAAVYVALYLLYSVVPNAVLVDRVYHFGIVWPAKMLINWLAPDEQATAVHNQLMSSRFGLSIVRGCDGSGVIFLLGAAILAFPARLKRKLSGLAGAVALVYVLNQARIVMLYFAGMYRHGWFTALHVYFVPTLMILAGTLYFAFWTWRARHDIARPDQA